MSDLTQVEQEAISDACGPSGPAAARGDNIAAVRCEGVEKGFQAAKTLWAERQDKHREAATQAVIKTLEQSDLRHQLIAYGFPRHGGSIDRHIREVAQSVVADTIAALK